MKIIFRRAVSLLLAIMMVFSIFTVIPLTASAGETTSTETSTETGTDTGTETSADTSTETSADTGGVTAKALYKSHIIEWSSETNLIFTVTSSDGSTVSNITSVQADNKYYYTALVEVGTNAASGTVYTVTNSTDSTELGKATVTDTTGKEALIKNSLVTKDYRGEASGYKTFDGNTVEDLKIGNDVIAKLKELNSGTVVVSATSTSTSTPQAVISLSDTLTDSGNSVTGIYVGVRNSSYNVGFRFNGTWAGTFTAYSLNKEKYTAAISITEGVGLRTAGNGANSFTSWDADERANMFKPFANCITGAYIGGMGNGSTAKFTGKVYYALITQEIYTNDELADITASDDSMGTAITNNMFNGNSGNTWVFVGGRDVEGPYTDVFGYKNYVSSFEEYGRTKYNMGSHDGGVNSLYGNPNRERYVINGGKTGNTLAKILENYNRLVVENDPKAISYIVGKEDYENYSETTIETFKTNLRELINRGLALRTNTGYVVIQTPYVPSDTTLYDKAKAYADAVNEVVSSFTVQQKRKIAVVDHFTLTDNDTFRTTCFNEDGTLNGAGHLTISKQMQTKVIGSCANWDITTLSMEGVTNHNTDATVTSTMSGKNLTINVSEVTGITQWTYYVEVDGSYTVSKVAGNTAIFKNLPVNKDYKLTIISADGRTQLTVMAGKTVDGNVAEKAVKFASLTKQQQAIHDLVNGTEPLTWLLMGDSITHGVGMEGHRDYDNLNGLFTKFIREELNRRDDTVVNTAVSSATTASTVARINERLNRYSPDVVIVQLGTNDATLTNAIPIDDYKANLQTIINAIKTKKAIPVLRAPTARLDLSSGGAAQPQYVQACKEIAEENNVLFINQYEITSEHISRNTYLRNSGQNGYLFLSDTVHFTANGQVAMIRMLLDGIGFETYNSNIYNNYYSVPHTDATDKGTPTVSESQGSITLNLEDISKVYSNPVSYVTLSATNGDFTYTAKVNNTKSQVSINDLPNGEYTVKIAVNLTNESKTVTFATQTVNISDSFAGDSVTAKALYKSHKIEWSSTGKEDVSVFTISNSAGAVSVTPTYVDVEGTRYYTAIISIATGTASGETYTVVDKRDNAVIGTDTVEDATGFEALAKNAVATFDYRATGGKIFDGTSKDQLIEISGGDPVKAAKLKALTNGSILVGYDRANTSATLFFGSDDGSYSVGVNSDKMFAVNKKSGTSGWAYLTAPSANTYSTYGVTSCVGGFWTVSSTSTDTGNYTTGMGTFLNASTSSKFYLGGQNTSTPKLFNGVIYYAIVSEEFYAPSYPGSGNSASKSYAEELRTVVNTRASFEIADVTAKALYKTHKIEWSSTTSSNTADFTIQKNDSTTAETNITYLTTISRGDRNYFTALVEVGANVSAGVKYTVTKGDTSISATVADNTGREALIKNAIVSKDYRTADGTGYKTIASADDVEKLDVSKATLEKLKTLKTGAMVASASRTSGDVPADTALMSLGGNISNVPFIGTRTDANAYGFKFNSVWAGRQMGINITNTQSVMATSIIYATGCHIYSDGNNKFSAWQESTNTAFIDSDISNVSSYKNNITGVYIGGTVSTSGKGALFTNGNIYFAVISEEALTGDDLAVITKVDLTNVKGVSTGLTHTISWSGTTNTGWTIKGNGENITSKATITHTDGVVTAVIPVSSTSDIEYVIENDAQIGTVLVKYVPVPKDLTAKALYKSHKLEWTSDREADYIVYSNGNKVEGTLSMVTDSDGKRYYTFIVSGITTGTGKGTEYELYVDPTNSITTKVQEKTGLEALIKNALVAKDYRGTEEGHKTFSSGVNAENLNVSAATLAKIKSLNSGSIIISAKTTDQSVATQPVIALSNSVGDDSGVYVGVRKTANQFGFRLNNAWKATFNCYPYNDGIHSFAVSVTEGAGVRTAGDGANSYGDWSTGGALFVPSADDITGVSIGGPVGENVASTFKGDVYYAIISEEIYTHEELADITQTNYNRLLSLISSTKTTLDSDNYKNDGNYRELQDAINLYSTYTSATDVATLNNAITQINTLSESLTVREAALTDEAISDETLKANADDNSHAGSSNDGSAVNMFDGNTATLWHTSYNNTHGSTLYTDTFNVDANHPVWMQTGFGKTEYITRIVCTPRTDTESAYKHQIKDYAVYVSNSDTKPVAVADVTETNDWALVQSGTLTAVTASSTERNQVITFSQPVQAKWIRLVVTSTSLAQFLCIAEMDIYKIPDSTSQTSDIANQIMDKLAEAKEMLNNANVVKDTAYEEYTAVIAELDKGDLTTEATQAKLEEITTKVAALSFTTTTADGNTATYTAAAQQTKNSIDEKLEEAKRVAMQSGVDAATLNDKITELEALTVTESADVLTTKLAELETQISTAKTEKKTPNKSETFDGDSVKWNNTADRVAILAKNAKANVERATDAVKFIFDGDYLLNDASTAKHYGSWRDNVAERMAPWIATGFDTSVCVSGIVIFDRLASAGGTTAQNCFKNYEVWVSNDADFSNYVVAATGTRTNENYSENGYAIKFDQPYDCQYIKFVTHGSVDCKIVEMDIYEYIGAKVPLEIKVTESTTTSAPVDKVLDTISFNKKFVEEFDYEKFLEQLLVIELSDIAHHYDISVDPNTSKVSVKASDISYRLTVSNKGTLEVAQTKQYNQNFGYSIKGVVSWKIEENIVCSGDTFNLKATDDMSVTAVYDEEVTQSVSAYIPTPVISYNGTKHTIQIPVYINGTTDYIDKGIVFVKSGTDVTTIENAILGTETSKFVKIFSAGNNEKVPLTNKGRYLHNITINGNLPAGEFYAYVKTTDTDTGNVIVTLSNKQIKQ